LVLGKDSKIVEDGNHDELVAKKGEYAKYWKMYIGEVPLIDV
jgi:ABC-type transport system involved in Fe-S cluster assembly fused permease/ATPase subunit